VLAVSINLYRPVAPGHRLLDLFLKDPGGDPFSGKATGNDMVIRFGADILVWHRLTPTILFRRHS
jgi:hypothetical protein